MASEHGAEGKEVWLPGQVPTDVNFGLPQHVLATLFGVVTGTIAKAERQARPLLEHYGHQIEPAATPIKTLEGLTTHASAHGVQLTPKAKPAR